MIARNQLRRRCRPLAGLLAAASAWAMTTRAEPGRAIDNFLYSSAARAQAAWIAGQDVPPAEPGAGRTDAGLTLPCPFGTRDTDRFYWDHPVQLDLSRTTSLELELSCAQPEAFRSLTIYCKSGDGWFAWARPLDRAGRQTLILLKSDFQTEGKPVGWHRIETIRISPWRGVPVDTRLVLHNLAAREDPVLVIRGTASSPEGAERRIAASTAARVSGWLRAMNIAHGVLDDSVADAVALQSARIAILPYAPELPAATLRALKAFVGRGGKLVVCYSSDEKLAGLLGLRLGEYKRAPEPLAFASFVFPDPARWMVPGRVYQNSGNIRPAYPQTAGDVIAWWEDGEGRRTGDPAWVYTPGGLWMSHILLDEDAHSKQHMLAALLAHFAPQLWVDIARPVIENAGRVDSLRGMDEALAYLRDRSRLAQDAAEVERLAAEAEALYAGLKADYTAGRYGLVLARGRRLRDVLTEGYARVQQPAAGEFRGVWDHGGTGWYPGDWERTARTLAERGMTAVLPNMLWVGRAHYRSAALEPSESYRRHGDQLDQCLKAARRHALAVHVWKVCWNVNWASPEYRAKLAKADRLQRDASGAVLPWLDPAQQVNVDEELGALKELVQRYPVDGVHLDYIRYPARDAGYTAAARRAFEQRIGRKVPNWPKDCAPGGPLAGAFEDWRAAVITRFVTDAARELKAINPSLKLSAAVFGDYPSCRAGVGQDWGTWLKNGQVDFVCPMNYTKTLSRFATLTHRQLALPGSAGRIFPGLGVSANESQLLADQAIEQVVSARRLGARGFTLFNLDPELRDRILPAFRLGITRP